MFKKFKKNYKKIIAIALLIAIPITVLYTNKADSTSYTSRITRALKIGDRVNISEASKSLFVNHLGRLDQVENEIIVNTINDLPTPTDTGDGLGLAHRLEDGKRYKIGSTLVLTNPIVLSNNTIVSSWEIAIVYAGLGALFRNNATTQVGLSQLTYVVVTSATGTNSAFEITGGDTISLDYLIINGIDPGNINGINRVYLRDGTFIDQKDTFEFSNITDVVYWQGVIMAESAPIGDSLVTFKNNIGVISMQNIESQPILGDSFINIDSATFTGRVQLSYVETRTIFGGIFFKSGSLEQTDPKVEARDCVPIPDSQTIGSFFMERNTTVTDITAVGKDGTITAFADTGGGQVTVTSAGHGLSNGNIVWIAHSTNYDSKYTISNVTVDTFEITETYVAETPLPITEWETNWTKVAGTTYPMENERASMSNNNQITFTNLEDQKVTIHVATNPRNNQVAATKDWEFTVIKNGVKRLPGTLKYREMTNKAGEGVITATDSVITGDYFEVYARSLSDTTTDMVMENMSIVIE